MSAECAPSWDPRDLDQYRDGNTRQRAAWHAVREVFDLLEPFEPILAGTVPLDVDLEGSDLDVICCAPDLAAFEAFVGEAFEAEEGFGIWSGRVHETPTCVARFLRAGFEVELFARAVPSVDQPAVRHLMTERALLERHGEALRRAVRTLKRTGLSTEEAFCSALRLEGNPYEVLLDLPAVEEGRR